MASGLSQRRQIATATVAYFETLTPERALSRQWSRELDTRDQGFMRAARLDNHVYRLVLRRGGSAGLTTFFAAQLGVWDSRARAELDEQLPTPELERRLPAVLVLHGFADEPELLACAARVGAAGAFTLREALLQLRTELTYDFENMALTDDKEVQGILSGSFTQVASDIVDAHASGLLTSDNLSVFLQEVKARRGLAGKTLYRPLRLALTGRLQGHDLKELMRLLELSEAGAPWSDKLVPLYSRVAALKRWLSRNTGFTDEDAKPAGRHSGF